MCLAHRQYCLALTGFHISLELLVILIEIFMCLIFHKLTKHHVNVKISLDIVIVIGFELLKLGLEGIKLLLYSKVLGFRAHKP
jgi:hypothetical protein